MSRAETTARAVRGRLALRFSGDGGRTRLVSVELTPPFHLQRLLYLDPSFPTLATAMVLNGTAGLCAGDRLALDVVVARGASVALTTPTMTRAFAMPFGHAATHTRLRVANGAYAELLPEPLLLCGRAAVEQTVDVDVEAGGNAAFGGVIAFGRAAAGEGHAYRCLRQRVEARQDGAVVLAERLDLQPAFAAEPGLLGGHQAYGSLVMLGRGPAMEQLVAEVRQTLNADQRCVRGGASLLHGERGIAVRVLSSRAFAAQSAMRAAVALFRRHCAEAPAV
jgi:urease accessory protein